MSDLLASSIRIGIYSPVRAFWVDWFLIHHTLYREDRLALVYGQRFLLDSFYLAVSHSIHALRVGGFSSEETTTLSVTAAFKGRHPFEAGLEYRTGTKRRYMKSRFVLRLSFRLDRISVVVNSTVRNGESGTLRAGVVFEATRSLSLMTGYRVHTNEIYGGFEIMKGALLLGFAWSDHPALGETYSFGIGRVWFR
jgi:hypothetical protein